MSTYFNKLQEVHLKCILRYISSPNDLYNLSRHPEFNKIFAQKNWWKNKATEVFPRISIKNYDINDIFEYDQLWTAYHLAKLEMRKIIKDKCVPKLPVSKFVHILNMDNMVKFTDGIFLYNFKKYELLNIFIYINYNCIH